jgi:hypothetical protein
MRRTNNSNPSRAGNRTTNVNSPCLTSTNRVELREAGKASHRNMSGGFCICPPLKEEKHGQKTQWNVRFLIVILVVVSYVGKHILLTVFFVFLVDFTKCDF